MLLTKHFKTPDGWVKAINTRDPVSGRLTNPRRPEGDCLNVPPVSHVEVLHTGSSRAQHFSKDLVLKALGDGWMSITDGVLTIKATPEDLHFEILRVPGEYPLPVDEAHPDAPDHETIQCYDCLLDEAQHARFCFLTLPYRKEAAAAVARAAKQARLSAGKEVARGE